MDIEIEVIGKQDKWILNQPRISIGRGAHCEVNLPARQYPSVTGEPAVLELVNGALRLAVGSSGGGGTYLNDRPASAGDVVRSGDILRLGAGGPELRIRMKAKPAETAPASYEPTRMVRVDRPLGHEPTRVLSSAPGSTADSPAPISGPGAARKRPTASDTVRAVPTTVEASASAFASTPSPRFPPAAANSGGVPAGPPSHERVRGLGSATIQESARPENDHGDPHMLENKLKFMRNLLAANLIVLVALLGWAFWQSRQLSENRKELQELRAQAQTAVSQLTPSLDARLGVFEKRLDAVDTKMRTAEERMEAGMDAKMKTVEDRMVSGMDANMKVAEDRMVARMNTEIPAMLDKYVNKKLGEVKH